MDQIAEHFWNAQPWKHDRYPFPSPEELGSESGLEKLRELWFHPKKRRRIPGLASMPSRVHDAAVFVQEEGLDRLKGESIHRTVCELEKIDGVGPKTAHCVALFGLGCMDAFPVDTHVTEAILSLYARNQFHPYAGYASQFLFMEGSSNPKQFPPEAVMSSNRPTAPPPARARSG